MFNKTHNICSTCVMLFYFCLQNNTNIKCYDIYFAEIQFLCFKIFFKNSSYRLKVTTYVNYNMEYPLLYTAAIFISIVLYM